MEDTSLQDGIPARRAALKLIGATLIEGRLLTEAEGALSGLAGADRARAQRLAAEVLRQLPNLDKALAPFLSRRPPDPVLNILRLGTLELAMGGAAHGVVSEAVTLAEGGKTEKFKGLVNAVLRRVSEAPPNLAQMPVPRLPGWLRGKLVAAWGEPRVKAMEVAHLAGAPIDVTAKGDAAALAEAVGGRLMPGGSVRLPAGVQVSALPGYEAGAFWVQDAAAALPARLLAAKAGETVLDLCAAPGGKTLQLAAAGAKVTAVDLSGARLERLRENLARTGLVAEVVEADALAFTGGPYDAILLDAPCSATGTIRRHPDLPHAKTGQGIAGLAARQGQLIDQALTLLKPGGRLVYCTCSLLPEEGEHVTRAAVHRHKGLVLDLPEAGSPEAAWIEPEWRSSAGGLRLSPDLWHSEGGIDGFWIARMTLPGGEAA